MANRRNSREGLTSLALLPFVLAGGAHAAHPFITDDTETQGKGRFELERRTQYTRMAVADLTLANCQFQPQLTYAAEERLDLILRPTYSVASGGASACASGSGIPNWSSNSDSAGRGHRPSRSRRAPGFARAISTEASIQVRAHSVRICWSAKARVRTSSTSTLGRPAMRMCKGRGNGLGTSPRSVSGTLTSDCSWDSILPSTRTRSRIQISGLRSR